jgi:hypothetical protein
LTLPPHSSLIVQKPNVTYDRKDTDSFEPKENTMQHVKRHKTDPGVYIAAVSAQMSHEDTNKGQDWIDEDMQKITRQLQSL